MNKLRREKQIQVVASLVEGNSINGTVRMTNVSKPTILKLIADLGKACWEYQDKTLRNLPCKRVQADEMMFSIAIHYMYYNFVRIHGSLRCTPAMKAQVTDTVWDISDMLDLMS